MRSRNRAKRRFLADANPTCATRVETQVNPLDDVVVVLFYILNKIRWRTSKSRIRRGTPVVFFPLGFNSVTTKMPPISRSRYTLPQRRLRPLRLARICHPSSPPPRVLHSGPLSGTFPIGRRVLFVVLRLVDGGGRTARRRRRRLGFLLEYAHVLGGLQEYLVLAERGQRLPVLLLLLVVPLHLGPPVLEPRDHLGVGQPEAGRYLVPVGRRQILLVQETFLQLEYLVVGKSGARFAFLFGLRPRVEQVQMTGTGVCEQKIK